MIRFFGFLSVLAPVLVLTTVGVSLLGFNHVDLTHGYFVQLVLIPACQALVITYATRGLRAPSVIAMARSAWRHELVPPVVLLDVLVIGVGWWGRGRSAIGFGGVSSLQWIWIGTKAIVAAGFLARLAWTYPMHGEERPKGPAWISRIGRGSLWIGLLSIVLGALGIHPFMPWLGALPEVFVGAWPRVLRWMVAYGMMFAVALGLLVKVAALLRRALPASAMLLEGAAACSVGVAYLTVLGFFLRPYLVEPWASIAATGLSVAASGALLSGVTAAEWDGRTRVVASGQGTRP